MVKFIADIGGNHNGDQNRLDALVKAAAFSGCWAVKPQLYKHDRLFANGSHISKEWEFKKEWMPDLKYHCNFLGLKLGMSVFYEEAVEESAPCVDFFKISSYDTLRKDLIEKCRRSGKRIFVSTGLSTEEEIGQLWGEADVLMHCVSEYPATYTNLSKCNKGMINGYSDHSRRPGVLYRAATMVNFIEFHLDLDGKGFEAQTTPHCWLPEEIAEVIRNIRVGEEAMMENVVRDKDYYLQKADPSDGLRPMKEARK